MSLFRSLLLCLALAGPVICAPASVSSYLGVTVEDSSADQGVAIRYVNADSPAAKAGLRPGDVLLSYNGETVLGSEQLKRLVWETPAGRRVKLQYLRDGKTDTVTVVTTAPPIHVHSIDSGPGQPNWGMEMNPGFIDVPIASIVWRNLPLGMEYEALPPVIAASFGSQGGLLIRATATGLPAEKAGLKPGDVLVDINGHPIGDRQDLEAVLQAQNRSFQVSVIRKMKRVSLSLQIPE